LRSPPLTKQAEATFETDFGKLWQRRSQTVQAPQFRDREQVSQKAAIQNTQHDGSTSPLSFHSKLESHNDNVYDAQMVFRSIFTICDSLHDNIFILNSSGD
jgi:hypothetical protein